MFSLKNLSRWLSRTFTQNPRDRRVERPRKPRLEAEALEARDLLTTTLYLDFGDGFAPGGLQMSVAQLRDINGTNTGPNLAPDSNRDGVGDFGYNNQSMVTLRSLDSLVQGPGSLNINFDGVGVADARDTTALENSVLAIVQRQVLPYDIDVRVASATSIANVQATLRANAGATSGEFDAYVFVTSVTSGGVSVGQTTRLFGLASGTDLNAVANQRDEAVVVFAENILNQGFQNFALANVAAHEAGHTFGLAHTNRGVGGTPSAPLAAPADTDLPLLNLSNLMREGGGVGTYLTNPQFFLRSDLVRGDGNTNLAMTLNAYNQLSADRDIGLRPGGPAYVTGTGAFDRITVTRLNATQASVKVEAFREAAFTNLINVTNYTLDNPGRRILIEAGAGDDEIILDAAVGGSVQVRAGAGNDRFVILGGGATNGRFVPNTSRTVNPDGSTDYGGFLTVGAASVRLDEFEPSGSVTVRDVAAFAYVTPNSADVVVLDNPVAGQNRVRGFSDGIPLMDLTLANVARLTVDTAANDGPVPADRVTVLGTAAGSAVSILTGVGDDTVLVGSSGNSLDGLRGTLTVDAGGGTDRLVVDDRANPYVVAGSTTVNNQYTITADQVSRLATSVLFTNVGPVATLYLAGVTYGGMESLVVNTGNLSDIVSVRGTSAATTVNTWGGADQILAAAGGNNLDALQGVLTVDGGADTDALVVNDQANPYVVSGSPFLNNEYLVSGTDVRRKAQLVLGSIINPTVIPFYRTVVYTALEGLTLNTGSQGDVITVAGTSVPTRVNAGGGDDAVVVGGGNIDGLRGALTVDGGAGTDVVMVDDRNNPYLSTAFGARWYEVTGTVMRAMGSTVNYDGSVERLSLAAGGGTDRITVSGTGHTALTVNAGAGDDKISVGNSGTLDFIVAPLSLDAGPGSDTLEVNDQGNTYVNTLLGGVRFYDVSNTRISVMGASLSYNGTLESVVLTTGNSTDWVTVGDTPNGMSVLVNTTGGDDRVTVSNSGPLPFLRGTLTIDGGVGTDTLSYASSTTAVVVDLQAGTATGASGGVRGFENAVGGTGNDVLIGNGADNVLTGGGGNDLLIGGDGNDTLDGGAGRDLLIGGRGSDQLLGGVDEDILVGGFTRYDTQLGTGGAITHTLDLATLQAILTEWTRTDRTYAQRTASLRSSPSGLNAATVFDDRAADTLTGSLGLDWFFAAGADVRTDPDSGELLN